MSREVQVRFCDSRAARSRPATHLTVLVHGTDTDARVLHDEVGTVLATMGLSFSQEKTRVVHLADGLDFLGFHLQWRCKFGTNQWYVYTFIAQRPIRALKAKIRALTNRTSQQSPGAVLIRLNQIIAAGRPTSGTPSANAPSSTLPTSCGAGRAVADDVAPLDVERRPPTVHRTKRPVETAVSGRDRPVQPRQGAGHPIPAGAATGSPPHRRTRSHNGSTRGEPGAWRHARRVRGAAWGNGSGAIPTPRPQADSSGSTR